MAEHVHVAVALDGAGSHPGAWRAPGAQAHTLTTAAHWQERLAEAEAGLLDFVTLADSFAPHRGHPRTDRATAGLDSVLLASRLAPTTRSIGLIPTATATHTEPFHVSKAIATPDYVSNGRAGVVLRTTADPDEAALFGRRRFPDDPAVLADLASEALDFATVIGLLWDSWEDDAEIRDVATGRFVDRDKLHYIDFAGDHFSVRGPAITPRPPQGRPVIAATGAHPTDLRVIGRGADLGFINPRDVDDAVRAVDAVGTAHSDAGRGIADPAILFVDLFAVLAASESAARARRAQLDEWAGEPFTPDSAAFVGTPAGLADEIERWTAVDGVSGVRLHPAAAPEDLHLITREVVPELQRRNRFRDSYTSPTLRGHLGLARPSNRFAAGKAGVA
ncbi:Coenzyme F420-dependent N5,N10-methylene tetrahydromethanopterin reductase-related flavin- dependent oxidoreductase [Gordonia terrae C-6]|uniref:Coenzyme F420-dependent N5,N10-methylene tetrahydromethanopterin reductase-related flavin-dependent oxidoreductase n=1 Tax=Gordonia terrae C-6 TaxID=1316928 RepID=R7Y5V1_9ACTN|nr:LLM class flavin-dependent oxidoreductase [Gordonia terrae]EON31069.1 Coenzyme F420-dependent N5,N10-methylene tetrahydromethanopterin reductase-related flavin- dependent oxidoreductase [Gordonia terrae C-6]